MGRLSSMRPAFVLCGMIAYMSYASYSCQCDGGSYWCDGGDRMRETFNCSGSENGRQAWQSLSGSDKPDCTLLKSCERQPIKSTNATCDDSCYDFCWKQDVGDCADMDDDQTFCVSQCMQYCTSTKKCNPHPIKWTPCQVACASNYMEVPKENISFVDYSMCMGKCT